MKVVLIALVLMGSLIYTQSKVKLTLKTKNVSKGMLKTITKNQEITYVTLIEGSRETYQYCNNICKNLEQNTLYAEVTDFPNYGTIFRCQCGDSFTSWYNMQDMSELCLDILIGDNLFNDYLNMLGYDTSDCDCSAMKYMLGKILSAKEIS